MVADRDRSAHGFLLEVVGLLGAPAPELRDYGAAKSVVTPLDGRVVEILRGRRIEIFVDLHLAGFPPTVLVVFAPEGLYERAKLLEDASPSAFSKTGDAAFDRQFVVLGEGASAVATHLAAALGALVDASSLRPSINPLKLEPGQAPEFRLHLRTLPTCDGADPRQVAGAVRQAIALAHSVERAWSTDV